MAQRSADLAPIGLPDMNPPHQTSRLFFPAGALGLTVEVGGRRMVRETVQHPGAVVIVPVLPGNRIVFVRQYRRSVDRELLELPTGTLGPRERKMACARRELAEETGWQASRLRRLVQFFAAPGFCSEQMTVFLATGLRRGVQRLEPDEILRPVILPLSAAVANIRSGTIRDAKSIIGILFAARHLKRRRNSATLPGKQ